MKALEVTASSEDEVATLSGLASALCSLEEGRVKAAVATLAATCSGF